MLKDIYSFFKRLFRKPRKTVETASVLPSSFYAIDPIKIGTQEYWVVHFREKMIADFDFENQALDHCWKHWKMLTELKVKNTVYNDFIDV